VPTEVVPEGVLVPELLVLVVEPEQLKSPSAIMIKQTKTILK
jgi:hypothetical protein